MSASVTIENATMFYDGEICGANSIDIYVNGGEFFSLLGPSGCGKTTILRMVSGFEKLTSGRILVNDQEITDIPAHLRNIGVVFQNYALFPHRNVEQNLAFGLRMRGLGKAEIARKVDWALELVSMTGFGSRNPDQLSGGEQQRIALARAIVIEPDVLLCDEPLGALDRKLRQQIQLELKDLQRELGLTTIFVTHDQEEAMTMSDRIAVVNDGQVSQIGTPFEVYNIPQDRFVAEFIGHANVFRCSPSSQPDVWELDGGQPLGPIPNAKGACSVALRPERVGLVPIDRTTCSGISGCVESVSFLGGTLLYRVKLDSSHIRILAQTTSRADEAPIQAGVRVSLSWRSADLILLKD